MFSLKNTTQKAYKIAIRRAQLKKKCLLSSRLRERVLRVYGHNTEAAERRFGAVPSLPTPSGATAGCASSLGHASELLPRRSVAFLGDCALLGRHFRARSLCCLHRGDVERQLRVGFYRPVDVASCGRELELGSGLEALQHGSALDVAFGHPAGLPHDQEFVLLTFVQ